MRKILTRPMATFAAFAFVVTSAVAQTGQPKPPVDLVPEKAQPGTGTSSQPQSLSEKLDQTNGVIKPKEVDPAIEKPAPQTGSDGVIKPPGTSGGSAEPQPK